MYNVAQYISVYSTPSVVLYVKCLLYIHQCSYRKTVVVGAGYIAVELAGILGTLGSDTHLLIRYDNVLRTFDQTLSQMLTEEMDKGKEITLHRKTQVGKIFPCVLNLSMYSIMI